MDANFSWYRYVMDEYVEVLLNREEAKFAKLGQIRETWGWPHVSRPEGWREEREAHIREALPIWGRGRLPCEIDEFVRESSAVGWCFGRHGAAAGSASYAAGRVLDGDGEFWIAKMRELLAEEKTKPR